MYGKKRDKVWYVLMATPIPHPFIPGLIARYETTWFATHTKTRARHLAVQKRAEGASIIDIFPGTKLKITHKYRGLK